jgi:uncharacterized Zn-finger protein
MPELIYESEFEGIKKEGKEFKCTYCSKKYSSRGTAKQHFSTIHKKQDCYLRPGDVSRALASSSKKFSEVAEKLDASEGRLHSLVKNSDHFFLKRFKPEGDLYIGEMM